MRTVLTTIAKCVQIASSPARSINYAAVVTVHGCCWCWLKNYCKNCLTSATLSHLQRLPVKSVNQSLFLSCVQKLTRELANLV